jgi:hypothetical protein
MNAIARAFMTSAFEARSEVRDENNSFALVALVCAIGLFASLCMAAYGPSLDLGIAPGFY